MVKRRKKSRRRRPKRLKRVDKLQNKRLSKLEGVARKLAFGPLQHRTITSNVGDSSTPVAYTGQIFGNQLPEVHQVGTDIQSMGDGSTASVPDFIYLNNLNMKFQITNQAADYTGPTDKIAVARQIRIIVFWVKYPMQYQAAPYTGLGDAVVPPQPPRPPVIVANSTHFEPNWNMLLHSFDGGSDPYNVSNMTAPRTLQDKGLPIVVISDTKHTLGMSEFKNSIKTFTVNKSYKSLKLDYTIGNNAPNPGPNLSLTKRPLNRQLFVAAYSPSVSTHAHDNDLLLTWTTRMSYTM